MSWADLDRLARAKLRADGSVTLVARDNRPRADVEASRALSTLVAIGRVARGRHVLDERFGGKGDVIYLSGDPPPFLVDAVSAAGGRVYDGTTEHVATSPLAATVQLDEACCDLATAVRRRLGAKTFDDALALREAEVRRGTARDDPAWLWPAVLELAAVTGELMRAHRPARSIVTPGRPPFALDLGAAGLLYPGKLALALAGGGVGSMRMLIALEREAASTAPVGRTMPVLAHRGAVALARLTWERLIPAEVDHDDVPVVAYVEDTGGTIRWPFDRGPPTAELRALALRNLAAIDATIEQLPIPGTRIARVAGASYAAEKLLDPAFMKRVASHLGGAGALIVATPVRGEILAIDASAATVDDDLLQAFAGAIARAYERAAERDRISKQLIVYQGKPIGRVGDDR